MFGIIATIIAIKKGHKTFAWIIGVWTGIAFVMALSGASQLAIAPGVIFLIIIIRKDNLRKGYIRGPVRYMLYCKNCGFVGSAEGEDETVQECPQCKNLMFSTGMERDDFVNKYEDERAEIINKWKEQTEEFPLTTLPKYIKMPGERDTAEINIEETDSEKTDDNNENSAALSLESTSFEDNEQIEDESEKKNDEKQESIISDKLLNKDSSKEIPAEQLIADATLNTDTSKDEKNKELAKSFIEIKDSEKKICPKCGKSYPVEGKFCPFCGEVFKESVAKPVGSKYCIFCGASLPEEAIFCASCGKKQPTQN